MIIIGTPLVVSLVGLLMYVLAANPKVCELGRIMFGVGLLVALLAVGDVRALVR